MRSSANTHRYLRCASGHTKLNDLVIVSGRHTSRQTQLQCWLRYLGCFVQDSSTFRQWECCGNEFAVFGSNRRIVSPRLSQLGCCIRNSLFKTRFRIHYILQSQELATSATCQHVNVTLGVRLWSTCWKRCHDCDISCLYPAGCFRNSTYYLQLTLTSMLSKTRSRRVFSMREEWKTSTWLPSS